MLDSIAAFLWIAGSISMSVVDGSDDVCSAPDAEVRVDHVVVAVSDLTEAMEDYFESGFTLKPGRPHRNGIYNAHFKFADDSSIELLTILGPPGDAMARDYQEFIENGGGGAFLALGSTQSATIAAAQNAGITAQRVDGSPFQYVTFPAPAMAALFSVEYEREFPEAPERLQHRNGVTGTDSVWVEAGDELGDLLLAFGGELCGQETGPNGEVGTAYAVSEGRIVIVAAPDDRRPRVVGITLYSAAGEEQVVRPEQGNGFWIEFQSGE